MDRCKTDWKRSDDGVGTRGMEDLVLQVRGRSLAGSKEFISEESYESEKKSKPVAGAGRCVIQKFIMYPDNNFRRLWTALVVGLLVYTGTVFIYRLIFVRFYVPRELEVPRFWNYFDHMVDIMFVMDLLIQFFFHLHQRERIRGRFASEDCHQISERMVLGQCKAWIVFAL